MKKKRINSPLSGDDPKAPLEEQKKWPEACRPHLACKISGVTYPAPASLDAAEVAWWIDYIDGRLALSRSMATSIWPAALAVLLGLVVSTVFGASSGSTWLTPVLNAIVVAVVLLVTWLLLRESDHQALEQRWLLYRERARELARNPDDGSSAQAGARQAHSLTKGGPEEPQPLEEPLEASHVLTPADRDGEPLAEPRQ